MLSNALRVLRTIVSFENTPADVLMHTNAPLCFSAIGPFVVCQALFDKYLTYHANICFQIATKNKVFCVLQQMSGSVNMQLHIAVIFSTDQFGQKTNIHLAPQGIEDTCPNHFFVSANNKAKFASIRKLYMNVS